MVTEINKDGNEIVEVKKVNYINEQSETIGLLEITLPNEIKLYLDAPEIDMLYKIRQTQLV